MHNQHMSPARFIMLLRFNPFHHKTFHHKTKLDIFLVCLRVLILTVAALGVFCFVAQQINPQNPIASWINPNAKSITGAQLKVLAVSGLTQGAMYGLIALGYSMVYGVLGFINFAHGEVFMVGSMTGMIMSTKLDETGAWDNNFVGSMFFIVIVAMIVSSLTAIVMEKVAYRPLRHSPRLIPLITSIGVSFFLQNAVLLLFGPNTKTYPRPPEWIADRVPGIGISGTKLLVIVIATLSMCVLWYLVECTKSGKAMRAVAEDPEIAALMGINVNRAIQQVFIVGGAMAGLAGVLWGLLFRSITHTTGFLPGIKAFSSAVVGGIGSLGGSMAGGVTIGLTESLGPLLILEPLGFRSVSQLGNAVAFVMLICVLLLRPSGMFGDKLSNDDRT